jgi:hypothetical protein
MRLNSADDLEDPNPPTSSVIAGAGSPLTPVKFPGILFMMRSGLLEEVLTERRLLRNLRSGWP